MKKWWLFILSFSLLSCGLETITYLDEPSGTINSPTAESGYDLRYFQFETAKKGEAQVENFGTAVYYKIYNNTTTILSNLSTIDSLNNSTNETAAATKVIEELNYKPLGTSAGTHNPLIENDNSIKVTIRLTNYHEEIGNNNIAKIEGIGGDTWIPLRYGNRWTFDFGRNDDDKMAQGLANDVKNVLPKEGDEDVIYGTFTDDTKKIWYVDMYAVTTGSSTDGNFTQYYSKVLHLGYVAIDPNDKHN